MCLGMQLPAPVLQAAGPATDAGSSAGNQALGKFGSVEGLKGNALAPLTSTAVPMRTVDDSVSFSGQVQCPSSREFLTVLVTPGAGGDGNITVGEDLDFDGRVDFTFAAPVIASGVCANGIITCDPGTWDHCRGYRWTSGPRGEVSLSEASLRDLGGCYCINNSCGANLLLARVAQVLGTVSGGVVGAIRSGSPQFTVTDVRIDGSAITYHGQATGGCASGSPGGALPTRYYSDSHGSMPGLLLPDAGSSEADAQSADPDSYYSMIRSSHAQVASPSRTLSCAIERVGSIETETYRDSRTGITGRLCTMYFLDLRLHRADAAHYEIQYLDYARRRHQRCGNAYAWEAPIGSDGWHTLATVSLPAGRGNALTRAVFTLSDINGRGCNTCTATLDAVAYGFDTPLRTCLRCDRGGSQSPFFTLGYEFETRSDVYREAFSNGCSAVESNPACTLQEETVDGVLTYANFTPTGVTPLPSCRTFPGSVEHHLQCRDWWRKERAYRCESATAWDFSDARRRVGNVTGTTADNGATMTYQDLRRDGSGEWRAEDDTATLGARDAYDSPIHACKTRRPKRKTDAGFAGNATQYLSAPDSWEFFYRKCSGDVCPLEPGTGEEIVTDCREINEFAEAATIMNVLEHAGKDMICSDGVRK
jgi:hypothetical protein